MWITRRLSIYFSGESTSLFITISLQNIAQTIQMFYNCLPATWSRRSFCLCKGLVLNKNSTRWSSALEQYWWLSHAAATPDPSRACTSSKQRAHTANQRCTTNYHRSTQDLVIQALLDTFIINIYSTYNSRTQPCTKTYQSSLLPLFTRKQNSMVTLYFPKAHFELCLFSNTCNYTNDYIGLEGQIKARPVWSTALIHTP